MRVGEHGTGGVVARHGRGPYGPTARGAACAASTSRRAPCRSAPQPAGLLFTFSPDRRLVARTPVWRHGRAAWYVPHVAVVLPLPAALGSWSHWRCSLLPLLVRSRVWREIDGWFAKPDLSSSTRAERCHRLTTIDAIGCRSIVAEWTFLVMQGTIVG